MLGSISFLTMGLFAGGLLTMLLPRKATAADWEQIIDEEGIKVWKREVPDSSLVEFRGRGVVQAPIALVAAVVRGSDRATEWMQDCNGARVVRWLSATRWISYNRTKSPAFVISDRDTVVENKLEVTPEKRTLLVSFKSVSDPEAPVVDGVVRMPEVVGHWLMVQVAADRTELEYQVRADPGGSLPHWLVNWASERLPFHTVRNVRAQVKAQGYEKHLEILGASLDWSAFLAAQPSG